jgi:hypothetical protein
MEERERCYSFILSQTPHETIRKLTISFRFELGQKSYWRHNDIDPSPEAEELEEPEEQDPRYFEPPPDQEVGISIHSVTKVYRIFTISSLIIILLLTL